MESLTPEDLQLRVIKSKNMADMGLLIGATGTGKSTAAKFLIQMFYKTYIDGRAKGTRGRVLIVDTKPRWRAPYDLKGNKTDSYYSRYVSNDFGDLINNAYALYQVQDIKRAWVGEKDIIIAQNLAMGRNLRSLVQWQSAIMTYAFQTASKSRPTMIFIDEGMDFFSERGFNYGTEIVRTLYRAGREKGISTLSAVQRPVTISKQMLTEANTVYLFKIRFAKDLVSLQEMGFPTGVKPPKERGQFYFFRDDVLYPRLMQFDINSISI